MGVDETEDVAQDLTDVTQTYEHQRDAEESIADA